MHSCRTLQQTQPLSVSMISSSLWKALPRRIEGGGLFSGESKRAAAVGCSVVANREQRWLEGQRACNAVVTDVEAVAVAATCSSR